MPYRDIRATQHHGVRNGCRSFYTPQCLIVHHDEEIPIWFGRAQDVNFAHIITNFPTENIISFSEPSCCHR